MAPKYSTTENYMNAKITSVSLRDVRCFGGDHSATLSRVTLLVGENSAGKSTLLGCLSAIGKISGLADLTDTTNYFDKKPFCMGPFDALVRSGSPSCRVGIGIEGEHFRRLEIEYGPSHDGTPLERSIEFELSVQRPHAADVFRIVREPSESFGERWRFDGPGFQFQLDQSDLSFRQFTTWLSQSVRRNVLPFGGDITQFKKRTGSVDVHGLSMFSKFINFFRHDFRAPVTPLCVRSIDPEGLTRLRSYPHAPFLWKTGNHVPNDVNIAGQELGLFRRIDVQQLVNKQYEVLADVSGMTSNLVDVGYGVSSVLPLIQSLVEAPQGTLFLLQQPEVHIHPSAQAQLVEMMATSNHSFIIETHSDHVIDWFRILVTEGRLEPSDVRIVYFERQGGTPASTRLHHLSLDESGNLHGQPRDYRRFFSEETTRLLGFPM